MPPTETEDCLAIYLNLDTSMGPGRSILDSWHAPAPMPKQWAQPYLHDQRSINLDQPDQPVLLKFFLPRAKTMNSLFGKHRQLC